MKRKIIMFALAGVFVIAGISLLSSQPVSGIVSFVIAAVCLVLGLRKAPEQPKSGTASSGQTDQDESPDIQHSYETYNVIGTNYYEDNLLQIARYNRKYDDEPPEDGRWIYKYYYNDDAPALVPEPTNIHDSNAIQVLLSDVLVGYISREDNTQLLEKISKYSYTLRASVRGGEYKRYNLGTEQVEFGKSDIKIKVYIDFRK